MPLSDNDVSIPTGLRELLEDTGQSKSCQALLQVSLTWYTTCIPLSGTRPGVAVSGGQFWAVQGPWGGRTGLSMSCSQDMELHLPGQHGTGSARFPTQCHEVCCHNDTMNHIN